MSYTIVPADAESAREAILELWRRNFPDAPAERYVWMYEMGPATSFLLCSGQERAVGSAGLMRREFRAFGKILRAGQAIDLNVDRQHRTVGPARSLQRTVLGAVARGELDLAYGFPNRQSEAVVRHAGYQTLGDLDRWVKPLSCRAAFDRWAWPQPLSRGLATVLDPILHAGSSVANGVRRLSHKVAQPPSAVPNPPAQPRAAVPQLALQEVDTFDARFDRLWEAAARQWPILGERTSDYLAWRFSRCPDWRYRAMCLSDSKGEFLGYVIYGRRGDIAYAADFLVADLRHLEPLLAEFLRLVRRQRAHMVVVLYFGRAEIGQALTRLGFWKRPSGRKVMLCVGEKVQTDTIPSARTELAPLADPTNWHLTGADIDTDG